MLTYELLTKFQKRWVDAVSQLYPQCIESGSITAVQCIEAYRILKTKRADGIGKVGYPNWLFNKNKIKRGLYMFPAKGVTISKWMQTTTQSKNTEQKSSPVIIPDREIDPKDKQFFDDLSSHGLNFKKNS